MSYSIHRLLVLKTLDVWLELIDQLGDRLGDARRSRYSDPSRFKSLVFLCMNELMHLDAPVMVDGMFEDYQKQPNLAFFRSLIIDRAVADAVNAEMLLLPTPSAPYLDISHVTKADFLADEKLTDFESEWKVLRTHRAPTASDLDFSVEATFRQVLTDLVPLQKDDLRDYLINYIIRLYNRGTEPDQSLYNFAPIYQNRADEAAQRPLQRARVRTDVINSRRPSKG